ncbi:hypothetical protein GCM10022380_34750 [Amycolatopsis tucumanensis]|uniref:Transposase DDE domain-containing protein n=1 Tax=Amycolatopsis tucumanensis TaxID=401106 RepID=A0ABP7IAQ7_9PSEU
MFEPLMAHLQVPRQGGGRARTRPDRVRGDKAYSSRAIHTHLRRRKIQAVIPEPADQARHRRRNVIERSFNQLKQWRGIATRYDKLATVYRAAILIHDVITWTDAMSDTP